MLDTIGFYSMQQVLKMVPLSRTHIGRLEKVDRFPRRVRMTDDPRGRFGYVKIAIHQWIGDRVSQ